MLDETPLTPLIETYSDESAVERMKNDLRTTHALFFHTKDQHLILATAHAVETSRDGVPLVGPGRPLSPEDEQTILDLLLGREGEASFEVLPANVLYRDRLSLMWWLPSQVRPMHLQTHKLGARTITTRWPSLVLLVRNRKLYLAALARDERPTADTPLFHGPMPNVFADSSVCTGSAPLPLGQRVADMEAWTSVVVDTAFTYANHDATLRALPAKSTKGQRTRRTTRKAATADGDYWATRDGAIEPFPDAQLNPLGWTLGQWLPVITGAHRARRAAEGPR